MVQTVPKQSRIFHSGLHQHGQSVSPESIGELITYVKSHKDKKFASVCIIENISFAMFHELCNVWQLDVKLLEDHFASPDVNNLWGKLEQRPTGPIGPEYCHLDGVYEYHNIAWTVEKLRAINPNHCQRHVFQQHPYPPSSNPRVTYCRPELDVYLFFVDAPLPCAKGFPEQGSTMNPTSLRFPYSRNYDGVHIPHLRQGEPICDLFTALCSVFEHAWQVRLLFQSQELFPPSALVYLLSSSIWETKFRMLDSEMKRISFREIRKLDVKIEASLHDLRASLALLRTVVNETITYVPPHIKDLLISIVRVETSLEPIVERLEKLEKRASDLHSFFIETIQLLAMTISIRDSQGSIEQTNESLKQTKQGIFLTRLAALYLPLSVATGVFGMNLREINDATPPWCAFIIVLVGLTALTFTLLWVEQIYHRTGSEVPRQRKSN